jgi:hypothetical protein
VTIVGKASAGELAAKAAGEAMMRTRSTAVAKATAKIIAAKGPKKSAKQRKSTGGPAEAVSLGALARGEGLAEYMEKHLELEDEEEKEEEEEEEEEVRAKDPNQDVSDIQLVLRTFSEYS